MTKKKISSQKTKTKKTATTKKFRSKFEETVAEALGVVCPDYEYETMRIPYIVERNYNPDFILPNGIICEAKGYFKSADQRKHKLIQKQHPEKDIRFVFQRASVRVQGSKLTCAEWCEKFGFLYAEGEVPEDWVKEKKPNG